MQMTDSRFIKMLWAYVGLNLAAVVATVFPAYSSALAQAYADEPETLLVSNVLLGGIVVVPLLVVWLAGLIGMFYFKRWARSLSLAMTGVGLVLGLFLGPTLYSPLERALLDASSILWGAILALSYFSASVSARFER